jgi:serine O-acetyltransferase
MRRRDPEQAAHLARVRAAQPRLRQAIVRDAEVTRFHSGDGTPFRSRPHALLEIVRLSWSSDAFLAQALYRVQTRLHARRIPVLAAVAHRLAIVLGQIAIDDSVVIEAGVSISHGQVVIGGVTTIAEGTLIAPFVSIGLVSGSFAGPTIERGVRVGTGARVLGPVRVGEGATIGANAVVLDDVAPGATVVGAPARPASGGVPG